MKKVAINEKCTCCGICVLKCPEVFMEEDNGKVCIVNGAVLEDNMTSVVHECPSRAIEIQGETSRTEVLNECILKLNGCMDGIRIPTPKDIPFDESYHIVYVPRAGISGYEYKSSSAAKKAGLNDFKNTSYSQIDSVILKAITEYRIGCIRPYYTTDEYSVYSKKNNEIADILRVVITIAGDYKLGSNFGDINVYPDQRGIVWKMLNKGELIGDNFIGMIKREFDQSVSDYEVYIDWDDTEDYRGKDIYCYKAYEASDELAKDLKVAFRYAKDDIEEASADTIKALVEEYNKLLKTVLKEKIEIIKKMI